MKNVKITANNYEKAKAQLEKIETGMSATLPTEVAHANRKRYTVALTKKQHNASKEIYEHSFMLQQFDQQGFEKISKNLKFNGFDKLIILHDPREHVEEQKEVIQMKPEAAAASAAPVKTEQQIRDEAKAEAKAEHDKELEKALADQKEKLTSELKATAAKPENVESTNDGNIGAASPGSPLTEASKGGAADAETDPKKINVTDWKAEQLKEFAKANTIDLTGLKKTEDILAAVTKWQNA